MLKAIVEEKNINRLLRLKPLAFSKTIFPHAKCHAPLQPKFHQLDFIARSIRAAITSAENRNPLPFRKKLLCEPDHHWSLARAPNGEIPDTNDCAFQAFLFEPSFLVHPNTRSSRGAINQRKWPKESAQNRVKVHRPAPFKWTAIFASARLVAPRLLSTRFRAFSLISFMRCGLRNSSIHATPTSSGLST